MRNKVTSLLAVLVVLIVVFAPGCSNTPAATSAPAASNAPAETTAPAETSAAPTATEPEKAPDPITFSMLMQNWPTWDEDMTKDPVGLWITQKTGVTVNVELVTGDYKEKLSLLLATGELPDFLQWGSDDIMAKFVANAMLVKLDEHLDAMPNVTSMYGNNLNAIKYLDDGHIYSLRQWYMGNTIVVDRGFQIRHDFMQKYFPDKADKPGTILLSDLETAFLDYKAKNPTTADGKTVYPMTNLSSEGIQSLAKMVFGITDWYEVDATNANLEFTHPNYVEMIKWLNSWYRQGLLDPEFAINKQENMEEKLTTGVSLATMCHESQTVKVNTALMNADSNAYLNYYRVAWKEGQDAYKAYSPLGSPSISLTTSCKSPDRALSFLNFMTDPLTNFVTAAGVEGGAWKYDDSGNVQLLMDNINAYKDTWERFRHFGAYKYVWTIEEGKDDRFTAWKGNVYEAIQGMQGGQLLPYQVGRMTFFDPAKLVNPVLYTGIDVAAGSDESVIETKITDIWATAFPEMVMAKSEADAVARYEKAIKDMNDAGLAKYEAAVSVNYFKKKALLESK